MRDSPLSSLESASIPRDAKTLQRPWRGEIFGPCRKRRIAQAEAGAHILDVNVGVSGIDEPRVLQEAIAAIGEVTDLPLCIDSALPKALEAALKVYKGKALVNSVNGERDKLERILPLVKGI